MKGKYPIPTHHHKKGFFMRQYSDAYDFGDKSGHHYRNKNYIYKEGVLYKLDCNQGIEVKRVTKELSGILTNIGYQRSI